MGNSVQERFRDQHLCTESLRPGEERQEGGDVAHLAAHRTGTPMTQVRLPGEAREFSPRVNFQCRLSYGVPTAPSAVERSCSPCQSSVDYGNTKTLSVHRRLGSATLSQPAFPEETTRISHGRNSTGTIQLYFFFNALYNNIRTVLYQKQ